MVLVGQTVHVNADLGDDDFAAVSPMPGTRSVARGSRRNGALALDLLIDVGDETVERLDMYPVYAQHDAMMRDDATVDRPLRRLALCLRTTAGQRRELEWILFAYRSASEPCFGPRRPHASNHR